MKISQLRQIIKEEVHNVINERLNPDEVDKKWTNDRDRRKHLENSTGNESHRELNKIFKSFRFKKPSVQLIRNGLQLTFVSARYKDVKVTLIHLDEYGSPDINNPNGWQLWIDYSISPDHMQYAGTEYNSKFFSHDTLKNLMLNSYAHVIQFI